MSDKKSLFRQQVIDEFNSKLNGEVVLTSGFSRGFIFILTGCFVLIFVVFFAVKIKNSKVVSGEFFYDYKKNLYARFLVDPNYIDDFYIGKNITANLSYSNNKIPLEIISVDKKLVVNSSKMMAVSVTAKLIDSHIAINGNSFQLTEGIGFNVVIGDGNISLFSWIKRYFSENLYG